MIDNNSLVEFETAVNDITAGNRKFLTNEYLTKGIFPIIDQGDGLIGGYTNENEIVKRSKDVVVFGDHTKILKYVDFDFCLGADGVKVLQPIDKLDSKFLYYFLQTLQLPDVGYSRHYKYLKRNKIPLPPLSIQKEIANRLDLADELRKKTSAQLGKYDELAQAVFVEMFGDPVKNEKGWEVEFLKNLCTKIGSGATPRGGKESYKKEGISLIRSMNVYDNEFIYNDLAFIDDNQAEKLNNVTIKENDVLFNITGASVCRCCIVPKTVLPARVNQHVSILRCKENKINSIFLMSLLINNSKKHQLLILSTTGGATREAITKSELENIEIILPPLTLQTAFAEKIKNIEAQKALLKKEAEKAEELFEALLAGSFGES